MKRYSFKIIVAALKEDVNRLFENNPSDVQRVISTINDPGNAIPQNMKLLAAWCMLSPTFTIQSVNYIIEHIISEKLKYKILIRDKTLVILSNSEEKTQLPNSSKPILIPPIPANKSMNFSFLSLIYII